MKEARYFYAPDAPAADELSADEAVHALRSLRLTAGDELFLIDGRGTFFRAVVTLTAAKRCFYKILAELPQHKSWHGHIHIAVAPTKMNERMEWLTEKATEIGFDEMTPLSCTFSERKVLRRERLEKITIAAMKQSRKPWKPVINEMQPFRAFVQQPRSGRKFIACCHEDMQRLDLTDELLAEGRDWSRPLHDKTDDITVLIGPEGDFTTDEVELAIACGYTPVTLGNSRLRTETAALYAVMLSQTANRIS